MIVVVLLNNQGKRFFLNRWYDNPDMETSGFSPIYLAYNFMSSSVFCNCAIAELYSNLLRSQASSSGQEGK